MDAKRQEVRRALDAAEREIAAAEAQVAAAIRARDEARWRAGVLRGRLAVLGIRELKV